MKTHCDIEVSVICNTYNHKDYIAKCLQSIVDQVTEFAFQIIVHDDASTDGTSDIVRKFHKEFPDIIVPVIQEKNLYSRGLASWVYIEPYLEGKYVALCEGDDWWIDSRKLQMQYDYMESHHDCSLCSHDVIPFFDPYKRYGRPFPNYGREIDLTTDQIIIAGGGFLGTNSYFYRSNEYILPEIFRGWGIGDYPRMIYLSTIGRVHVLPVTLSAYRLLAKGSWTERTTKSMYLYKEANEKIIDRLNLLDLKTEGKYHDSIVKKTISLKGDSLMLTRDWKGLREDNMSEWFMQLRASDRVKLWVKMHTPKFFSDFIQIILNRIRYRKKEVDWWK